ncbi:MAG: DUF6489 family protein [Pseudomonadota bacterium]
MKINIEVDVSPEEARHFFGLPDVEPLQKHIMERVQKQVEATADPAYFAKLAAQFVSGGVQSMDTLQRTFVDLMRPAGSSSSSKTKKATKD